MLSNYRIKTEAVTLSDGTEVVVRGVNLSDIMEVYKRHQGEMEAAFLAMQDGTMPTEDKMALVMRALEEFPALISSLVASAANEPEQSEVVRIMPIGDQLRLADAVFGLTMSAGITLKNLERALSTLPKVTTQSSAPEKKLSSGERKASPPPAADRP